jgi:hypothetical protein
MRHGLFAEACASLLIVMITGVYVLGGIVLSAYLLAASEGTGRAWGLIPLVFACANLPILVLWCRQLGEEIEPWVRRPGRHKMGVGS